MVVHLVDRLTNELKVCEITSFLHKKITQTRLQTLAFLILQLMPFVKKKLRKFTKISIICFNLLTMYVMKYKFIVLIYTESGISLECWGLKFDRLNLQIIRLKELQLVTY